MSRKSRFSMLSAEGRESQPEHLRKHVVSLELVQRLHLGVEYEPMSFTSETIAEMLQEIADVCDPASAFAIHGVVRALRGDDRYHRLELKQKKRGKFVSLSDHAENDELHVYWLHELADRVRQGIKTEAAVVALADEWRTSRATVFEGIRHAKRLLELEKSVARFVGSDGIADDSPGPAKSDKA